MTPTDYRLATVLDTGQAATLREELLARRGRSLAIDASGVERLGALCLQVLLAARRTWSADGRSLVIAAASEAFARQWTAFGADPAAVQGDAA